MTSFREARMQLKNLNGSLLHSEGADYDDEDDEDDDDDDSILTKEEMTYKATIKQWNQMILICAIIEVLEYLFKKFCIVRFCLIQKQL